MKAVLGVLGCPLEGLPHPESRHVVLTKLETSEYVLKVPRGGKSAVWKIFLHVTNTHGQRIDFVLCRYCYGLFMYKGYASGTSSLMNHGIRCLDRPKKNTESDGANANVLVQEEWPEAFKVKPFFTLSYLKKYKSGRNSRSPSPVTLKYSAALRLDSKHELEDFECGGSPYHRTAGTDPYGNTVDSYPEDLSIKLEYGGCSPPLQHIPLYTALHVAAQKVGLPVESLLRIADGLTGNNGQRSMLQDGVSNASGSGSLSSGGGSGGPGSLCGIEAVVAAAAAAAAVSGDNNGGNVTSPITTGNSMGGQTQRQDVTPVGMSPPPAPMTPTKPESYQLRHNNHLSLVLNQLAEDEAFMDVTLTAEGRPIKAHKSVLSAVSPYFSSVLRANPCQHPIIIMPRDIRFSELSSIIMYIYKGEMTVSAEDLPSLLKTAELLRITGLSPGENQQQHQQQFNKPCSSSNNNNNNNSDFSNNLPQNFISASSNTSLSCYSNHFTPSVSIKNQQQQQQPQQQSKNEKINKSSTESIDSPNGVHEMLNPSDFMDLDMTCVKEEMNSDDEEEENSCTFREVTTPPAIENPLSSSTSNEEKEKGDSPRIKPNLEAAADGSEDAGKNNQQDSKLQHNHSDDSEADNLKRNSLKTLANLVSQDTPTDLSPSDNSSKTPPTSESPTASTEPEPNVCPFCQQYIAGSEMSTHLSSKHAFKPAFICTNCGRVYVRKHTLEQHSKACSLKQSEPKE